MCRARGCGLSGVSAPDLTMLSSVQEQLVWLRSATMKTKTALREDATHIHTRYEKGLQAKISEVHQRKLNSTTQTSAHARTPCEKRLEAKITEPSQRKMLLDNTYMRTHAHNM